MQSISEVLQDYTFKEKKGSKRNDLSTSVNNLCY